MTTSSETRRAYRGPAIFGLGFRPFFLGAALWSSFAVTIWVVSLALDHSQIGGRPGLAWHMDEMLFGFLPAVFAGFLLAALPNWTGRLPIAGQPLAMLFALWAAGRLVSVAAADLGLLATVVDASFLFVFASVTWREILAAGNRRNLPVCLLVTALALAHLFFHLREAFSFVGDGPERAALAVAAGMIALIGGRIVPSFTRNWLSAQGQQVTVSAASTRLDRWGLALLGLALAGWVAAPASPIVGWSLAVAGIATIARLARWQGLATAKEALVWILHIGYLWLGLSLLMIGGSVLAPQMVAASAGIHALTTGAIGVMVLAVMTRATLGHTGRKLSANAPTVAAYVLINLAAGTRVAAPFVSDLQISLVIASAVLWSLAFLTFAAAYFPFFLFPRAVDSG